MRRVTRRLGLRSAVTASLSAVALLLGQGLAFGDTAGWSFRTSNVPVVPGAPFAYTPQWLCQQGTCTYDANGVFRVGSLNGTSFNHITQPRLVKRNSGTQVGTCTFTDQTQVLCSPTGSGTVSSGDALTLDVPIVGVAPRTTCTPAAYADWYSTAGAPPDPGQEEPGQVQYVVTLGLCDPLFP